MTCAQGLLRLLWGGPKLECYGTEHKSQKFFQSKLAAYVKEQRDFEAPVTEKVSEKLTLASFQMTHVLLKTKRPYTELQTVVLPCLKIAEALIHGGRNSVAKVEEIPVSDTTVYRRSLSIGEDLKISYFLN